MASENVRSRVKIAATHVRYRIFAVLWILIVINFIDRSVLSIGLPFIDRDLHLSTSLEGWILGAFFWTYLLMQVPGGYLLDRFGPRRVIGIAGIVWGGFQMLMGVVSSGALLFVSRLGLGAGEAPMFPAGAKLNANWLSPRERARGATFIDAAGPFGAAVGGLLTTGLIALFDSWRWPFVFTGAVTLLLTLVYFYDLRDRPEQHRGINSAELDAIRNAQMSDPADTARTNAAPAALSDYAKSRSFWAMMVGRLGWALVWWGLIAWVPSYFVDALHFSLASLGWGTFFVYGMGFAGEIFAGVVSDAARARFDHNRVMRTMFSLSGLIAGALIVALPFVTAPLLAVVLLGIAIFFILFGGLYWAIPAWLAPASQTGRIGGVMNVASAAGGGLAPVIMGYAISASGGHDYTGAFIFLGGCALLYVVGSLGIDFNRPMAKARAHP